MAWLDSTLGLDAGTFADAPEGTLDLGYHRLAWWEFAPTAMPRVIVPGSLTETTIRDERFREEVGATTVPDWDFRPTKTRGLVCSVCRYTSSNNAVIAPVHGAGGWFEYVGPGTATISASHGLAEGGRRLVSHTVTVGPSVTNISTYLGGASGSVRASAHALIAHGIAGGSSTVLFSTYDLENKQFVRNPNCWLCCVGGIDLSGIVVANSAEEMPQARGGALITPRHVVCAMHFPLLPGMRLWFVTAAGDVIYRDVVSYVHWRIVRPTGYTRDWGVAKLNADVEGCAVYPLMPSTWPQRIPPASDQYVRRMPVVVLVQQMSPAPNRHARLLECELYNRFPVTGTARYYRPTGPYPLHQTYAPFSAQPVPGDSGSPIFTLDSVNGLVLWGSLKTAAWGDGPYGADLDVLTAMVSYLGAEGHTITVADWSSFNLY